LLLGLLKRRLVLACNVDRRVASVDLYDVVD